MSRNLCRTECVTCGSEVGLRGTPYLCGEGFWVADAECTICGTKYTAWIGSTAEHPYGRREADAKLIREHCFYDLSYRSTFNDEPGPDDLPKEKVETFRVVKIGNRQFWFETQ